MLFEEMLQWTETKDNVNHPVCKLTAEELAHARTKVNTPSWVQQQSYIRCIHCKADYDAEADDKEDLAPRFREDARKLPPRDCGTGRSRRCSWPPYPCRPGKSAWGARSTSPAGRRPASTADDVSAFGWQARPLMSAALGWCD